jgi:hypothetical protein
MKKKANSKKAGEVQQTAEVAAVGKNPNQGKIVQWEFMKSQKKLLAVRAQQFAEQAKVLMK